jgi:hypothetical protein
MRTSWGTLRKAAVCAFMVVANIASADDINIAQIGPFTGLPSPDAHEINAGALAYFAKVNAAGGVSGRQLTLTKFDDGFNGENFVKQLDAVKSAKKYVALLSPIGSAGIGRALKEQLFDDAGVIVINAVPGSDALRSPGHPNLFHVRAGDAKQLERVVMHAKVLNLQKLMVLHHDLPIGVVGLASIKAIAERVGGIRVTSVMSSQEIPAITAASIEVAPPSSALTASRNFAPRASASRSTRSRMRRRSLLQRSPARNAHSVSASCRLTRIPAHASRRFSETFRRSWLGMHRISRTTRRFTLKAISARGFWCRRSKPPMGEQRHKRYATRCETWVR